MSTFEEEGFLSTAMVDASQQCRKQFAEWFKLCESINKFSLSLTSKAGYHPDNRQEWLTAALFLRIISIFEAIIILTERCMLSEAWILLRALMEAVFSLCAISTDKQVTEEYYQNHLKTRRRALKKLRGYYRNGTTSKEAELTKLIEELQAQIELKKVKDINVEYLARKAGLEDFYNTAHSFLSWKVHANILDIARTHLIGQSDDYVESVHLSVQIENPDMEKLFLSVSECMVIALRAVDSLFKAGVENEIADYDRRYKNLWTTHRETTDK